MRLKKDDWMPTRYTLIQRLKNLEDDRSWEEFFDLYEKLIYGVARKSGLADVEAEEVVQETLVSVARKIEAFDARADAGSFRGWLRQLTRWRIMDQVRKRRPDQIARDHKSASPRGDSTTSTGTEERIPDPAGNEFERLWDAEWVTSVLEAALAALKTKVNQQHYQVFQMHVLRERPAEDVARVFGITSAQVHVIKHRLKALLARELKRVEASLD